MDDCFGNTDSRLMPEHLFSGALRIDHETAIRANPEKQNCGYCPRYWYVDAHFKCEKCGCEFVWTASEQKAWFEDYFFWVDAQPRQCRKCGAERRRLAELRKEYDATVAGARSGGTSDQKRRIIEIVDELTGALGRLPDKMMETKELFERQIGRTPNQQDATDG